MRKHLILPGRSRPAEVIAEGKSLEEVRRHHPEGYLRWPRSAHDDPVIVETWMDKETWCLLLQVMYASPDSPAMSVEDIRLELETFGIGDNVDLALRTIQERRFSSFLKTCRNRMKSTKIQ